MKFVKTLFTVSLLFAFQLSFAQWDGNNTTSGIGAVGISSSTTYKFRVYNNSNTTTPYGLRVDNYYTGSSTKYGIYNYLSSGGSGTRYGIYSYAQSYNDYSIYSGNGKVGFEGDFEMINSGINNTFLFHTGWQSGDYSLYITPVDGSGTKLFDRSLFMHRDGYLEKKIDNSSSVALAVSNSGTRNFIVLGSGKVFAREIEVKLGTIPDYVFEKDYTLMPLNQLREYVSTNKHLPNIPSAKEIEENGIGLGELSRKHLEKIEELTLYILELNEKIEVLEEKIENEKRKN